MDAASAERSAFEEALAQPGFEPSSGLYEQFLRTTQPAARRRHGVYFTPPELVEAQVRLVEDALRNAVGCAGGFGDPRVGIVDPAVGSGAYPRAILERAPDARPRMWLFETQPGAVMLARAHGLNVSDADALATQLKLDTPIAVCLGNPPYRRQSAASRAAAHLDGFGAFDASGIHRKNLYNDYVYFWSWALRTLCDQRRGPAIVCFVTAASYLRGPAFGAMRRRLRAAFDALWVIDLEGDQLAARASENVFAIRTPIAITLGVRRGDLASDQPARVRYARLEGSGADKLHRLQAVHAVEDLDWRDATSGWTDALYATRRSAYATWPLLTELFPLQLSGAQLKRTWPIGITREVLQRRWRQLLELPPEEQRQAFVPTRDRDVSCSPPDVLNANTRLPPIKHLRVDAASPVPVRYAYRAFDRQWVLPDARCGDFLRPRLWQIHGPKQLFLTTMLTNVLGRGPAAIVTNLVPDMDHFRGSFGARGVIPLWCDAEAARPNVKREWLDRLSQLYGFEVSADMLLEYCYALLAAPGYTQRFEEELRTPGPRIPLTRDADVFCRGVAAGEALVRLHTFVDVPVGAARPRQSIVDYPSVSAYDAESEVLCVGSGVIGPVGTDVWAFSVSGYRILPSWLRRRSSPNRKRPKSALDSIQPINWTAELTDELLQLIWLIQATLARQASLDALLEQVVAGALLVE